MHCKVLNIKSEKMMPRQCNKELVYQILLQIGNLSKVDRIVQASSEKKESNSVIKNNIQYNSGYKLRICLVINGFHNGGIEKVLENYFSHMNRDGMDIHVISHMEPNEEIEHRFRNMGFTIHHFSYFHARDIKPQNMKEYDEFFKKNHFDIVHNNVAINILPLMYAKKYHVPVRILHSHTDYNSAFENKSKLRRMIYRFVIKQNVRYATHYFSCGIRAGESIFGRKLVRFNRVTVINNAIDTKKFTFDEKNRNDIRTRLGLKDEVVIGHVGRYEDKFKNQSFIVEVFKEYLNYNDNAKLLMIGDGKERVVIENKCKKYGFEDKVIFTGAVSNVNEYLSAMDVFVFPSIYEGLSVATLEAQCSDLPGVMAENLSPEMNLLGEFKMLSLAAPAEVWAKSLVGIKKLVRKDRSKDMTDAGYEINVEANKLRTIYFTYVERANKR